jgi:hypothetical protein
MPLFLQALPLSLKTLWRYLLLLPFLTALTAAVTLVAAFIPIIGFIVPGVMTVLCTLAGLRCALSARGHASDLDLGKLIRASFWYFVLGIVAGLVLAVLIAGLGMVTALADGGGPAANATGSSAAALATLALGLLYLFVTCGMAVPMTAAAATATTRGMQSDLFWGFGSGMVSLAIVAVLGFLVNGALFVLFHDAIAIYVILQGNIAELAQRVGELPNPELAIALMIGSLVFTVWMACWFFATSVLAWERAQANLSTTRLKAVTIPRVSSEDLRAPDQPRRVDRRVSSARCPISSAEASSIVEAPASASTIRAKSGSDATTCPATRIQT